MVIFGFSSSNRTGGPIVPSCEHCGEAGLVSLRSFRYFHLFFLPVLPLGSKKGTSCTHCLQTQWGKGISDTVQQDPNFSKQMANRPRWHFIGPAIVGMLIAAFFLSGETDREIRSAAAAASPTIGDVWIVNIDDVIPELEVELNYAVARVDDISADGEVFLGFSDWQYESWLTAYRKAKDAVLNNDAAYFTTTGLWFSTEDVVKFEKAHDLSWAVASYDVE